MNIRRIKKPDKKRPSSILQKARLGNEKKSMSNIRKNINLNNKIGKKNNTINTKSYGHSSSKKYNKQNYYKEQMQLTKNLKSTRSKCPEGRYLASHQINYVDNKVHKLRTGCYPIV